MQHEKQLLPLKFVETYTLFTFREKEYSSGRIMEPIKGSSYNSLIGLTFGMATKYKYFPKST